MSSHHIGLRLLRRAQPKLPSTAVAQSALRLASRRAFQTSARRMETQTTVLPARRPVGAFRGGLFGFLAGSVSAGAAMYYYVVEEYRVANELLIEDIYNLQTTVQRVEGYVKTLEDKVDTVSKKK